MIQRQWKIGHDGVGEVGTGLTAYTTKKEEKKKNNKKNEEQEQAKNNDKENWKEKKQRLRFLPLHSILVNRINAVKCTYEKKKCRVLHYNLQRTFKPPSDSSGITIINNLPIHYKIIYT